MSYPNQPPNNAVYPSVKFCPKCNLPMKLQVATKGGYQGKYFHVCPNFGQCQQAIPVEVQDVKDQSISQADAAPYPPSQPVRSNKSKITWGWITLVMSFGIPMLLASSSAQVAAILALILQVVSLVLGISLWRSSNPAERKNGIAITIIWLIIESCGFGLGLLIGLSGGRLF